MTPTPEQQTAQTILQKPDTITIRRKTYTIPPPTMATLIETSAIISTLPIQPDTTATNFVETTLRTAKDWKTIGLVLATLILGAKPATHATNNSLTHLFHTKTKHQRLADDILHSLTPKECSALLTSLLSKMQIADFFAITTFLGTINTTKPTKVVETTAPGQQ